MEHFASGRKPHYYGKGDVSVYRLRRDGATRDGVSPMFGANVLMLVYGDAFWPTYATGDNTGLIATDSMKNFIQRETLAFCGQGLEDYCRFLGEKFLASISRSKRAGEGDGDSLQGTRISIGLVPSGRSRPSRESS